MKTIKIPTIITAVEVEPEDIAECSAASNIPFDEMIIATTIATTTKTQTKPLRLIMSPTKKSQRRLIKLVKLPNL